MTEKDQKFLHDEAILLHVKNWQSSDKYVVCFTKNHGKLRFIAYGARYVKNVNGRLLQPFANLAIDVQQGNKIDKLCNCELLDKHTSLDVMQMAYGAVVAELTALLTEDREVQTELYDLLQETLKTLPKHNPRLVTLSFAIKILSLVGLEPQIQYCVNCGTYIKSFDDISFNPLQGGIVCNSCKSSYGFSDLENCQRSTFLLWKWLKELDFNNPQPFVVRGGALMELEKILYKFIFFQIDKPLNSLNFLAQLGL